MKSVTQSDILTISKYQIQQGKTLGSFHTIIQVSQDEYVY